MCARARARVYGFVYAHETSKPQGQHEASTRVAAGDEHKEVILPSKDDNQSLDEKTPGRSKQAEYWMSQVSMN